MRSFPNTVATGVALIVSSVFASSVDALPIAVQSDVERKLFHGEPSLLKCTLQPPLQVSKQNDTALIVGQPSHCETDNARLDNETSFWSWGGTSGPVFSVYYRAHEVSFAADGFNVVSHHVDCSNGPDVGCVTYYDWDGTRLEVAAKNYPEKSVVNAMNRSIRPIGTLREPNPLSESGARK